MSCEFCGLWKHFFDRNFEAGDVIPATHCPSCGALLGESAASASAQAPFDELKAQEPHTRAEILEAAKKCVCQDRNDQYGSPEESFNLIAKFWSDYLRTTYFGDDEDYPIVEAKDVAAMVALLKIARIAGGSAKADNWVDLCGYGACGGELDRA